MGLRLLYLTFVLHTIATRGEQWGQYIVGGNIQYCTRLDEILKSILFNGTIVPNTHDYYKLHRTIFHCNCQVLAFSEVSIIWPKKLLVIGNDTIEKSSFLNWFVKKLVWEQPLCMLSHIHLSAIWVVMMKNCANACITYIAW